MGLFGKRTDSVSLETLRRMLARAERERSAALEVVSTWRPRPGTRGTGGRGRAPGARTATRRA
ncbi:MAG: hypothetical protein IPJ77_21470 [Planctomycetes bacterium]|nr:hypothetical protein [Planctomycetota bacterium]